MGEYQVVRWEEKIVGGQFAAWGEVAYVDLVGTRREHYAFLSVPEGFVDGR